MEIISGLEQHNLIDTKPSLLNKKRTKSCPYRLKFVIFTLRKN